MQEDEVGATLGNFVVVLIPAPMDEVEVDPRFVLLRPPTLPMLPVMPLPMLTEGERPNLGTLNQEFLLPDSYKIDDKLFVPLLKAFLARQHCVCFLCHQERMMVCLVLPEDLV